jgi:hypothetical protein
LDALTIAYEGDLQATGLLAGAQQDLYMGEVAKARGDNERTASYVSAGASILSGAASYGAYKGGAGGSLGGGYDTGYRGQTFAVNAPVSTGMRRI